MRIEYSLALAADRNIKALVDVYYILNPHPAIDHADDTYQLLIRITDDEDQVGDMGGHRPEETSLSVETGALSPLLNNY